MVDMAFLQYLIALALASLLPAGALLIHVAGQPPAQAGRAAVHGLVALGLGAVAYWAVGFALQFGGVGLVYTRPELLGLVWEWSALPAEWGTGWGMAGLSGWFLQGAGMTATVYALFLAHLPWAMTAALVPALALQRRTAVPVAWSVALLSAGVIYPVAGNWVQGGGWLAALGRNLGLGHGFVDFAGGGTVFLVGGLVALAGLLVWPGATPTRVSDEPEPPRVYLPLMAITGGLLFLVGALGWSWSNPLYLELLGEAPTLRAGVNVALAGLSGTVLSGLYGWFVRGESPAAFAVQGVLAGTVAALAMGPFVPPGVAVALGLMAGGAVPLVTYLLQRLGHLYAASGVVPTTVLPAATGLLAVGLLADGLYGAGWNQVGPEGYLGVPGQGVSGIWVAASFEPDLLGQFQAQLIGLVSLGIWGFAAGSLLCVPLGLLQRSMEASPTLEPDAPADDPELPAVEAEDSVVAPSQPETSNP